MIERDLTRRLENTQRNTRSSEGSRLLTLVEWKGKEGGGLNEGMRRGL